MDEFPISSMGLVYLPTCSIKITKCRYIYIYTIHRCYGFAYSQPANSDDDLFSDGPSSRGVGSTPRGSSWVTA